MKAAMIILAVLAFSSALAQNPQQSIRKGNDLYRQGDFAKAEAAYSEALNTSPGNQTAKFNRAASMEKQDRHDEAIKQYDELIAGTTDVSLQAKAYYNKGAILSKQKKLEESIEAYKNALRRDPSDTQARENLQKALLELRKKQPPPPRKQDEKKKEEKKQQQQQPKMNKKEAEQKLKLLEQKERELQQRMQNQKSSSTGGGRKDW